MTRHWAATTVATAASSLVCVAAADTAAAATIAAAQLQYAGTTMALFLTLLTQLLLSVPLPVMTTVLRCHGHRSYQL
jgi:hypothetical protein